MYVGITSTTPCKRWRNGIGYRSCPYFYNAIQKYGWDGFDHEIFASHLTQEEAENMEKLLIAKLQTQNHEFGYNVLEGGFAPCRTEEQKQHLSQMMSGENNPHYGVKHSPEIRQKISAALTGKHLSEEHKKKLSIIGKGKCKGRPRPEGAGRPAKPILYVETGEIFESIAGAAREKGIGNKNRISAAAKGTAITVGGYHWQYHEESSNS